MADLRNYTPHRDMAFYPPDGEPVPLPPSGNARAARTSQAATPLAALGGVPVNVVSFGEVTGLPDQEEDVYLVVSMLVAQLLPDRVDLLFPDELVRDADGSIIGFRSLARLSACGARR